MRTISCHLILMSRCLVVMANCARDFIRKRTLTDVLPPLLTFFKTLQVALSEGTELAIDVSCLAFLGDGGR